MTERKILVWCEIPVSDMAKSMEFYGKTFHFDMKLDESGPNPISFLHGDIEGAGGHIYPGKPADIGQGPTVHLAVPDTLEKTAERFVQQGGKVLSDPIPIPMGRFVYGQDPDGNSIGMYEPNAA